MAPIEVDETITFVEAPKRARRLSTQEAAMRMLRELSAPQNEA